MTKREWKKQLFFAIVLSLICLGVMISGRQDSGTALLIIGLLAAHSWYQVIRWAPKSK